MRKLVSTLFALSLMAGAAVVAEAHGRCGPRTRGINRRQEHQQQRIGQGIRSGELTAREDIVISGRVEGSIQSEGQLVTIKPGAAVEADALAREIVVAGRVNGSLSAQPVARTTS